VQETRHWHEDTGITTSGREKSDAEDYRYFPEPDLVPVAPSREWVEEIRATLPEAPSLRRVRLQEEWGFTDLEMRDVINGNALEPIVATIELGVPAAAAKKWWLGELARFANEEGLELGALPVGPAQVAEVQKLVDDGTLNDKLARQVFEGLLAAEGTPAEVIEKRGLALVSDDGPLLEAIDRAIAANPDVVEKVNSGKPAAAGALIGAVMKDMRGQADAAKVRQLLNDKLGI
jgi:aspartyl-tRNA(Asn)/glutamyl-tRNA(Gln) amidotransferase subunit B